MKLQIAGILVASLLLFTILTPTSIHAAEQKIKKTPEPKAKKTTDVNKKKLKPSFQPFEPRSKPEEPAKTQPEKPKLESKSSTKTLDMTGKWTGNAVWSAAFDYYDPDLGSYREVCRYQGSFSMILQQNGNAVTGDASLGNVIVTAGRKMEVCSEQGFSTLGSVNAKMFGSGFSGTVGPLNIKGSVTSDLMNGQVTGSLGGQVSIDGKFIGNRAR